MIKKILIVEDDRTTALFVQATLKKHGFETITANDGHEALNKVQSDNPDLVLLDIQMPEMNGLQCLTAIRQQSSREELPVIMLTAVDGAANVYKGREMGANRYLTKPVESERLLEAIQDIQTQQDEATPASVPVSKEVREEMARIELDHLIT